MSLLFMPATNRPLLSVVVSGSSTAATPLFCMAVAVFASVTALLGDVTRALASSLMFFPMLCTAPFRQKLGKCRVVQTCGGILLCYLLHAVSADRMLL